MIGTFWNIRGLNKTGRIKCLADFIKNYKLDFVAIQETKKSEFLDVMLRSIDNNMTWNFMPSKGSAGGILVGFKILKFDIISWQYLEYRVVTVSRS
jgi:exonuclease III